eukprot:snap_masked-scaffold363_size195477-processed-gene-0.12 protein:Tk06647 transcript:snap_masked-scaffold363_size195477-processed-gene-0.12-mRNA-1 annotation:"hypothetical protein DAPPUDRAFT_324417"
MPRGGGRGRRKWKADNGFEAWGGYMAAKIAKLEGQFSEDAHTAQDEAEVGLFRGIAIFVNGYTDPSADELKRVMMLHGGTFHHYFNTRKTTHIIATNLPDTKVKALKGNEPICHPRWITESLAAGHVLDYRQYLLYTAQTTAQTKLNFPAASPARQAEASTSERRARPPPRPTTSSVLESDASASRDESRQALDANDSRFLGEFYHNSRLHHISTMGANFKRHINELREKHASDSFPTRSRLASSPSSGFSSQPVTFMHIDMDCFFVSVGLRQRPELVGQPVAVAHAKGAKSIDADTARLRRTEMAYYQNQAQGLPLPTEPVETRPEDRGEFSSMSELASVSYEARNSGVKNGMFLGPALQLCPTLKTIPYDFEGYNEVAYQLYDIVAQYTLDIQAVSCDEMLVDITEVINACHIAPLDFAQHLRGEIWAATRCHASVGLGPNLLLARLATRKAKPNGAFLWDPQECDEILGRTPVRDLPGVGRKMCQKLEALSVSTCRNLQSVSLSVLQREFGAKTGQSLYNFCRGHDHRRLNVLQERKSVSAEVNYGIRFKSQEECGKFLDQLSGEVAQRLVNLGVQGKVITLKLMIRSTNAPQETSKFMGHGICDSTSKSSSLATATQDKTAIFREVGLLYRQMTQKHEDVRGIGVQIGKLEGNTTGVSKKSSAPQGTKSILSFVQKIKVPPIPIEKPPPESKESSSMTSLNRLSYSQIDMEVFDALPEEIRSELQQTLACPAKTTTPDTRAKIEPSTSVRQPSEVNLTFSQVDPDFLAALPSDLVEELRLQYASTKAGDSKPETAFDALMNPSSALNTSPAKTPPKAKRGRPAKNSPRFIKRSKAPSPSLRTRNPPPRIESETPIVRASEDISSEVQTPPSLPTTTTATSEKMKKVAHLDGFTELVDLRRLLREWVQSKRPTQDDITTVGIFLQELIEAKEIEMVSLLLKLLRRHTDALDARWQSAYSRLEDQAQTKMCYSYGHKLWVPGAKI